MKNGKINFKVLKVFLLLFVCSFLVAFATPSENVISYHYKNMGFLENEKAYVVFENKDDLYYYLEKFPSNKKTSEMKEELSKFNDEYFNENVLILANVSAKSSSISYYITDMSFEKGNLTILLTSKAPIRVNQDMANWNIFIEYKKLVFKEINIIKDGINISQKY